MSDRQKCSSLRMPPTLRMSLQMLLREWRSGELSLLFAALTLGVALVTGIGLFAERLQGTLVGEASVYLGADRVLQASEPVPNTWLSRADTEHLRNARTTLFPTMVYKTGDTSDRSALASLKAVSDHYPLRGELEIRTDEQTLVKQSHGPAPGTAWVDANVLNQLDMQIGDRLDVGTLPLRVAAVLVREGDGGSSFYGMGSRVMINDADLAAAGLILPGSRVEYRYLFAGEEKNLDRYVDWLKPQLNKNHRLISLHDNQPGIAGALDKAALFLQLAGSLGVLLAALAAAFAAQHYSERHTDGIAVMKTLGARRQHLLTLLGGQLAGLWLLATLSGFVLGLALQWVFLSIASRWLPTTPPAASLYPFAVGAATSLICLLLFVWPAFARLTAVPPWRVLRTDDLQQARYHSVLWYALPGMAALLLLYSGDLKLVGLLLGGLLALVLPAGLLGFALLRGSRALSMQAGSVWRLGIANVLRRRWLSLLQIIVFGIGFMLLAVMVLLRTSLLHEWQLQIPSNAPNVFLINIAPGEVEKLGRDLQNIGIRSETLYPMVRGRLATINDKRATDLFDESVSELYRELNLSWSAQLPADNTITAGNLHASTKKTASKKEVVAVSIEAGLAKRLNLSVGSTLGFTIGDATLDAEITSIRHLQWDKMTPNFYFLFPPGALDNFNATWMTSVHRDAQQAAALAKLLRHYPSVTAYPVDELIQRIQTIVERASLAVEAILMLVLVAGLLVLLTCLRATLDQRLHESALLRTLGASQKLILGSLLIEFACLGLCAGLLAACGAELSAWALQTQLFHMAFTPHPWLWLATPLAAVLLTSAAGTLFCRRSVSIPPVLILRELA